MSSFMDRIENDIAEQHIVLMLFDHRKDNYMHHDIGNQ